MGMVDARETPRIGRSWIRFIHDQIGTTAVEFALVSPILFTLIFGGIEFGRLLWTEAALNYSVQEGARCWVTGICASASQAQTTAAAATPQLNFSTSVFTPTSGAACGCKVSASYAYSFLVSGLVSVNPTLTAQACFPYIATGSNATCQP